MFNRMYWEVTMGKGIGIGIGIAIGILIIPVLFKIFIGYVHPKCC